MNVGRIPGSAAQGDRRMRRATLPMYAEPEMRPALELWWAGVARHLRDRGVTDVPGALTWTDDRYRPWRSPDLLFSQTCGQPFVHLVGPSVQLVATPHYGTPGCEGPTYRSFIVVRDDLEARSVEELRGKRLAANGHDSWSGYHVWRRILVGIGAGSGEVDEMFGPGRPVGLAPREHPIHAGGPCGRLRHRLREPCAARHAFTGRAGRHAHSRPFAARSSRYPSSPARRPTRTSSCGFGKDCSGRSPIRLSRRPAPPCCSPARAC